MKELLNLKIDANKPLGEAIIEYAMKFCAIDSSVDLDQVMGIVNQHTNDTDANAAKALVVELCGLSIMPYAVKDWVIANQEGGKPYLSYCILES